MGGSLTLKCCLLIPEVSNADFKEHLVFHLSLWRVAQPKVPVSFIRFSHTCRCDNFMQLVGAAFGTVKNMASCAHRFCLDVTLCQSLK